MSNIQKNSFDEIVSLIKNSKQKLFSQVNFTLIELYWNIGEYISKKLFKKTGAKVLFKSYQFL